MITILISSVNIDIMCTLFVHTVQRWLEIANESSWMQLLAWSEYVSLKQFLMANYHGDSLSDHHRLVKLKRQHSISYLTRFAWMYSSILHSQWDWFLLSFTSYFKSLRDIAECPPPVFHKQYWKEIRSRNFDSFIGWIYHKNRIRIQLGNHKTYFKMISL